MAELVYLGCNRSVDIKNPLDFEQPIGDRGWWLFTLMCHNAPQDPNHMSNIMLKNAGDKMDHICGWLTNTSGEVVNEDNKPALVKAIQEQSQLLKKRGFLEKFPI